MRTLQRYITMDLVRAATMATVACTLVMSIIGIIEPLREQGLSAHELVAVLAMTMVMMLSLCLPVAMLFAATIVYGRFSQDNELTACRASGVSTIATLRPGLYLAAAVTIITLLVSNLIVPYMAGRATEALYSNMKGAAFAQLNRKGVIELDGYTIRVDYADVATDSLYGIIVVPDPKVKTPAEKAVDPRDLPPNILISAAEARILGFHRTEDDEVYIKMDIIEPRAMTPDVQAQQYRGIGEYGPLPNPIKSEMKLASWGTLFGILRDPVKSPEIKKKLQEYHRDIGRELFVADVVAALSEGRHYDKLRKIEINGTGETQFDLFAPDFEQAGLSTIILKSRVGEDRVEKPVEILITRAGGHRERITARRCRVQAKWSAFQNALLISLDAEIVESTDLSEGASADIMRTDYWTRGEIPLPAEVMQEHAAISLSDLYNDPPRYTADRSIRTHIEELRTDRVPKVRAKAIAEMHTRLFYSLSCFFIVALGAALGMIFRGGQVISAFVLSLIPMGFVILLLAMGREMIRSEDIPASVGVTILWGGLAVLAAGTGAVYAYLSRQ